jgi:hypothetical protein
LSARPIHNTLEFDQVKSRLIGSASSISPTSQLRRIGSESLTGSGLRGRPEGPAASFKLQGPSNWDGMILNESDGNSEYLLAPKGGYGRVNNSMLVTHGVFVGAIRVPERDLHSATAAL